MTSHDATAKRVNKTHWPLRASLITALNDTLPYSITSHANDEGNPYFLLRILGRKGFPWSFCLFMAATGLFRQVENHVGRLLPQDAAGRELIGLHLHPKSSEPRLHGFHVDEQSLLRPGFEGEGFEFE